MEEFFDTKEEGLRDCRMLKVQKSGNAKVQISIMRMKT